MTVLLQGFELCQEHFSIWQEQQGVLFSEVLISSLDDVWKLVNLAKYAANERVQSDAQMCASLFIFI